MCYDTHKFATFFKLVLSQEKKTTPELLDVVKHFYDKVDDEYEKLQIYISMHQYDKDYIKAGKSFFSLVIDTKVNIYQYLSLTSWKLIFGHLNGKW